MNQFPRPDQLMPKEYDNHINPLILEEALKRLAQETFLSSPTNKE